MKQGTLFYDRESGRYNFFIPTRTGTGGIFYAPLAQLG